MGISKTITVDELAAQLGITKQAILSHSDELKRQGAFLDGQGELQLPVGTRPHFNKGRLNLDGPGRRYYAILKATEGRRFVDNVVIQVPPEEFPVMLKVLVEAGLLVSTGTGNTYGANGYITTIKAAELLEGGARRAAKQVLDIVSPSLSALGELKELL